MSVRPDDVDQLAVIRLGNPVLRRAAVEVPDDLFGSDELHRLSASMVQTMLSEDGVGLAAPQVAESLRLFVYWLPETDDQPGIEPRVLVNPEVRAIGDTVVEGWEGCLSIPGLRGLVPRFDRIKVKARDLEGEPMSLTADGFHARVIQHEFDHLNGTVFLDRMRSPQSLAFEQEWEEFVLAGVGDNA